MGRNFGTRSELIRLCMDNKIHCRISCIPRPCMTYVKECVSLAVPKYDFTNVWSDVTKPDVTKSSSVTSIGKQPIQSSSKMRSLHRCKALQLKKKKKKKKKKKHVIKAKTTTT